MEIRKKAQQSLIALINLSVFGKKTDAINQVKDPHVLEKTLKIASNHSVLHLASDGLLKSGLDIDEALLSASKKKIMQVALRCELMDGELCEISDLFSENEICHMPLKGAVMRKLYPEPWMRTSCDIDILVKPEDAKKASDLLVSEFQCEKVSKTSHDILIKTKNDTNIELHFSLFACDEDGKNPRRCKWNYGCLENIWEIAELKADSKYCFEMNDETLYFYLLAHMAKHIEHGGSGVKSLLDLYILNSESDNRDKRYEYVKRGNLENFEQWMLSLSKVWFEEGKPCELTDVLSDYIINGGAFGTKQNAIIYKSGKEEDKKGFVGKRIWVSDSVLRVYFPIIDKKPWLVPFCQIARWIKIVLRGDFKKGMRELKMHNNVTDEDKNNLSYMIDELGL